MADNTTLKVTIIGDSRSAQRAVSQLGGSSDGLVSKLGGVAATVGKAFGGAAIILGGVGLAAGAMGLEVAAGNEQAEIAFTTMLGSGKKAQDFLKDLQAFAASTPFEFPELQTAASSLISAGIEADKVIPIMTTLGDVTSGMGTGSEGVKRATVALQQMNAAGKITGEDLNQLRDAGIPVYDLLAKATGKSKAEIVDLAQKGKLGKKELTQMMDALGSGKGLERFSGLMEKQSASLTGMWSTFKDTLGQGLAKVIEPLIPLIKDGLGAASKYLADVLPKVTDGLKNVVDWTKNFISEYQTGAGAGGTFRTVLETVWAALVKLWQVVSVVVGWMIDNKEVTLTFIGILATAAAIVKTYTAVQWLLNAALAANPIGLVVLALAALAAGFVYLWRNSQTFRTIVTAALDAVGRAAQMMWEHFFRPVFKVILMGISALLRGWAGMLRLLGNVPGFEWAADAADKIDGAADSVDGFNDKIDQIDPYVPVKVETTFTYKGYKASLDRHNADVLMRHNIKGYATGGTNIPAGLAWVGERGPELMYVPGGSTVYDAETSQRMARSGGGKGGGSVGGSAGGVTVIVNVHGSVMTDRDLARALTPAVRDELVKIGRRNNGVIFPK